MAILSDLVKNTMEVFMDDFFRVWSSFGHCLHNLSLELERCRSTNLVLNWGNVTLCWKRILYFGILC